MAIKRSAELKGLYRRIRPEIESRLAEFAAIWSAGSDRELFIELVFCLLTPQSGARRSWNSLCGLIDCGDLFTGDFDALRDRIRSVRFMNTKAHNILLAREMFFTGAVSLRKELESRTGDRERRRWLVAQVRGIGFKEASHYLRNIGLGCDLAILDRHILRRLAEYGVIAAPPKSLTNSRYEAIETAYLNFSRKMKIPPLHMDLLLWYKTTGEIFK